MLYDFPFISGVFPVFLIIIYGHLQWLQPPPSFPECNETCRERFTIIRPDRIKTTISKPCLHDVITLSFMVSGNPRPYFLSLYICPPVSSRHLSLLWQCRFSAATQRLESLHSQCSVIRYRKSIATTLTTWHETMKQETCHFVMKSARLKCGNGDEQRTPAMKLSYRVKWRAGRVKDLISVELCGISVKLLYTSDGLSVSPPEASWPLSWLQTVRYWQWMVNRDVTQLMPVVLQMMSGNQYIDHRVFIDEFNVALILQWFWFNWSI